MSFSPVERILGVPAGADPATLLGLGPGAHDRVLVESALQTRLEGTYTHPEGRSMDAELARRALRAAAATLIGVVAAPGAPDLRPLVRRVDRGAARIVARRQLTEFDRAVLATLVAGGGWNAGSRARLVALSASYGVTAAGLLRVMRGLAEYAAAGGPRFDVREITSGAARLTSLAGAHAGGPIDQTSRLGEELSSETVGQREWPTIKLSILFGLITVFAFVMLLRVIWPESPEAPPAPPAEALVSADGGAARATPAPKAAARAPAPAPDRLAIFRPPPTFLGNALPSAATDAADRAPQLAAQLDLITRKLSLSDEPAEAVFRSWEDAVGSMALGWVLVDDSTRTAVATAISAALHEAADAPTTADRLLTALAPPRERLGGSMDVWRGAWKAGTLAVIGASRTLPASVAQQARMILERALVIDDGVRPATFDAAADQWLRRAVLELADRLERDADVYDAWEAWLAAQRKLPGRERFQDAVAAAIRHVLATATDLSRAGPSVNVLGRLLTTADFRTSELLRARIDALFEDEAISAHDLWVTTSILAQSDTAPWFDESLVLPPDAGTPFRRRIRDRIMERWPAMSGGELAAETPGRGVMIDPRAGGRWRSMLQRTSGAPLPTSNEALMVHLLIACRMNEVAALLAARDGAAAEVAMDDVERLLAGDAPAGPPGAGAGSGPGAPVPAAPPSRTSLRRSAGARPGQVVGRDGEWAEAYAEVSRSTEEKLNLLRQLRNRAGTDLGPIDSEVFVRELYRGSPREIRSLARAIAIEQFADGPEVAMELLDQFPDAPRNESVSETLRRLCSRILPPVRSGSWPAQARLALVEHALALRRAGSSELDERADQVRDSFVIRARLARRDLEAGASLGATDEAARILADAWRERALATIARWPVPDDLDGLARRRDTRRRLVAGPIQAMVAQQLAVLDYLTYVTVAEQPALRDDATALLAAAAQERLRQDHVLRQAIETERAIAAMWSMRVTLEAPGREARP